MNAKQEFLEHIGDREVKCAHLWTGKEDYRLTVGGDVDLFLEQIDFEYHDGYGEHELFGTIWYADGTWSEREDYDGSEWWAYRVCPDVPSSLWQRSVL